MAGFILPIISGLAGLFGGGQQQKTNQNGFQQQQSSGLSQTSGSTTPSTNPLQQSLANLFTSGAQNQYNQSTNLQPYTTQQLGSIQAGGQQSSQALQNAIAARGLSFSPAAANAQTMNTLNTGNQMQGFLQQVPLLQKQLQSQSLQQLMSAFATQPTGVNTMGSTWQSGNSSGSSTGSGTVNGNPMGGLFGGLGAGLAAILPMFM